MIGLANELRTIIKELRAATDYADDLAYQYTLNSLLKNINTVESAWYRSWFGYQANVYYSHFNSPPLKMFMSANSENELKPGFEVHSNSRWFRYSEKQVFERIEQGIDRLDLSKAFEHTGKWIDRFGEKKEDILAILRIAQESHSPYFERLASRVECLHIPTVAQIVESKKPDMLATDDPIAKQQGIHIPPHILYYARVIRSIRAVEKVYELSKVVENCIAQMERISPAKGVPEVTGKRVFVGHGRSLLWRELKDYLQDVLGLQCKEFNLAPSEGNLIPERLTQLLDSVYFALLIMTAEDKQADGTMHARQNVVHETGLFQGRLGFDKAIVLLEEGCVKFSNNSGLVHLPFPPGNIKATFYDIRRLLSTRGLCSP